MGRLGDKQWEILDSLSLSISGERGSNRYLGNAQMKQKRVFPKDVIFDILEQKLLFINIVNFGSLKRFVFGFGGKKVSSSH